MSCSAISIAWGHGDEHIDPNMKVDDPIEAPETPHGHQGVTREAHRTITIVMNDSAEVSPGNVNIAQGETIRLQVTNVGNTPYYFVMGSQAEIDNIISKLDRMPDITQNASSAPVPSGSSAEIIWQFTKPGEFLYAGLRPETPKLRWQGKITVAASGAKGDTTQNDSPINNVKAPKAESPAEAPAKNYTLGEIRKISASKDRVAIKLGQEKNLGMPGMTMVLKVNDPSLLSGIKVGDEVEFVLAHQNGALTITELRLRKAP
jgi:Cu/Ag efflux protein CusF